tara:strand:- start:676 stop:1197 length:522 start_codon:yes stop_codon:yes gene_type:complete
MEEFLNILMGIVPAVVVGVVSYMLINRFLEAETGRHVMEIKKETVRYSVPVRMQAYERMILLLERLDPVKAVNRVIQPGMTSRELQKKVIADLRNEFDHNITQQLYVSKTAWLEVKKAKDESMKILAITMSRTPDHGDAMGYTKMLIQVLAEVQSSPTGEAIEVVRREATKIF